MELLNCFGSRLSNTGKMPFHNFNLLIRNDTQNVLTSQIFELSWLPLVVGRCIRLSI